MHRSAGRLLSYCEGLLFLGWIVLMGFVQARGDSTYRTSVNFLLFHFLFTGIVLLVATIIIGSKKTEYLHWSHCVAFLLAIGVDVNNLLETVLYLPRNVDLWYGVIVLNGAFLFMSTVVFLWYASMVWRHGPQSSPKMVIVVNNGQQWSKNDPQWSKYFK